MKKILLLASISFLLVQCNKSVDLPELATDNDYKKFELKDRVCEVSQKVTLIENTNYTIEDKNINYSFNLDGYLISDIINNNENNIVEENNYEKLTLPVSKKQYINQENFSLLEFTYDSLKNLVNTKKLTNKNQIIEEQKNSYIGKNLENESYFIGGNSIPSKTIKFDRNGDFIKNKVIFSKEKTILDSIVYEYKGKNISKQTHFDSDKKLTGTEIYTYNNKLIKSILYLDAKGMEIASELFEYNKNNQITNKKSFTALDKTLYEEKNTYNDKNKIQKSEILLNGSIIMTTNQTYDKYGNIIRFENKNLSNKENLEKTFIYTYDKKGNWISKEVSFNNVPTYKVSRTIKYCNE